MISFNSPVQDSRITTGIVLDSHISVKAAAEYSGYNVQYLRRLLRAGILDGIKIGQVWLIRLASLEKHLQCTVNTTDRRCGPRDVSPKSSQCSFVIKA